MAPKNFTKPLTKRPLDLTYYSFFLIHFIISLCIDLLVLWPAKAQTTPGVSAIYGVLRGVVDDYRAETNDPLMRVAWGVTQKPWDFAHMNVLMYIEVFFQVPSFLLGMIGLKKDSTAIYPLLLAYSSASIVTTIVYMNDALVAPSIDDPNLDSASKLYAMSEEGRWTILKPTIPFLIIPIIMWVDMMFRLGRLVRKGAQVERAEANKKGNKQL